MARAAVALESPNPGASARPSRPQFRPRRLHALLIAIAIVAIWLVFVFARALGDVDHATARKQSIAAEAATLQARLDADHREQLIVQTDGFQAMQARAYGLGAPGEIVFSLPRTHRLRRRSSSSGRPRRRLPPRRIRRWTPGCRSCSEISRQICRRISTCGIPAASPPPGTGTRSPWASADRSTARPFRCRRSARRSGRTKP